MPTQYPFQFGLRTLLAIVTLASVGSALVAAQRWYAVSSALAFGLALAGAWLFLLGRNKLTDWLGLLLFWIGAMAALAIVQPWAM